MCRVGLESPTLEIEIFGSSKYIFKAASFICSFDAIRQKLRSKPVFSSLSLTHSLPKSYTSNIIREGWRNFLVKLIISVFPSLKMGKYLCDDLAENNTFHLRF